MNRFLDRILSRCEHSPDARLGVVYEAGTWRDVTLCNFVQKAKLYAGLYQAVGECRGRRILIILKEGLEAQAAFIGAMLSAAEPAILPYPSSKQDPAKYWGQHRLIFQLANPLVILVYDEIFDTVKSTVAGSAITVIRYSVAHTLAPTTIDRLPSEDDVAFLQHSSGTTGIKKGVALSYRAMISQFESYSTALRIQNDSQYVFVSWLPLYHDMGLISSFLMPLWLGIPVVSINPFDWLSRPYLLFDAVDNFRGTHAWLPNFAFLHLARSVPRSKSYDLNSIVSLVSCSEPCKAETFDVFLRAFEHFGITRSKLQTCYAMAETVFAVSQSTIEQPPREFAIDRASLDTGIVELPRSPLDAVRLLSNGTAIEGCQVQILGPSGFFGEGRIGEICVSAPFLFSGYSGNEAATAEAFYDGWYRTGDLGFIDDSELFVTGRIKDLVILNGKNVYAHDVEQIASRVPGVKGGRVAAFGRYDRRIGSEMLVVLAERDMAADITASRVIAGINMSVFNNIGVKCGDIRIVEPGWLVKTTSGKTSRSDNAKKYSDLISE